MHEELMELLIHYDIALPSSHKRIQGDQKSQWRTHGGGFGGQNPPIKDFKRNENLFF